MLLLKRKFLLKTLLVLFLVATAFLGVNLFTANYSLAIDYNADIDSPISYLEYFKLSSPTDVAYSDGVFAFLENNSSEQNLVVYQNGVYSVHTSSNLGLNNNSQVKILQNFVITQQDSRPYAFNLTDNSYTQIADINCQYFDFNDNYFIALNNAELNIYNLSLINGVINLEKGASFSVSDSIKLISINDNNDIFYFNSLGQLCKKNIQNVTDEQLKIEISTPNYMISNQEYIFYSTDSGIGAINIETGGKLALLNSVNSLDYTGLGNVVKPKGMAFYNDNILVCDSDKNTVQEFKLINTTESSKQLTFTGFAVATTERAVNRLGTNAVDIKVLGNLTIVLEKGSILIRDTSKNATLYEKVDITSYTTSYEAKGLATDGNNVAIFLNQQSGTDENSKVIFYNIKNKTFYECTTIFEDCCDITYSNGYFYILSYDIKNSIYGKIIKFDTEYNYTTTNLLYDKISAKSLIASDVDGFIYLYVDNEKCVYKLNNDCTAVIENDQPIKYTLNNNSISLQVDLLGNIYSLTQNNKVEKIIDGQTQLELFTLTLHNNLTGFRLNTVNATAFSISYDKNEVSFIFDNEGFIAKTTALQNVSTQNILAPQNLVLTGDNANPSNLQKIYVKEGVNLYSVKYDSTKTYLEYETSTKSTGEYFISATTVNGFYFLLGNTIKLVKTTNATVIDAPIETLEPKTIYATTNVNLYYYPVLAENYDFYLTNNEQNIKIQKGTSITAIGKVQVNNYYFYLVSYTINGNMVNGYLPESFATDNLAELYIETATTTYSIERIKGSEKTPTIIYKDSNKLEVLTTITNDSDAKIYQITNNVALISVVINNVEYIGFIDASNIIIDGENAIRNALIVLLVAISVSATSIFFVLRKKDVD